MEQKYIKQAVDYLEHVIENHEPLPKNDVWRLYELGRKDAILDIVDELGIKSEVFEEIQKRGIKL